MQVRPPRDDEGLEDLLSHETGRSSVVERCREIMQGIPTRGTPGSQNRMVKFEDKDFSRSEQILRPVFAAEESSFPRWTSSPAALHQSPPSEAGTVEAPPASTTAMTGALKYRLASEAAVHAVLSKSPQTSPIIASS